jgi:hypothetical protein
MERLRPGDPQRVGRYRLLKRLGSGGMGQVYLGRSPGGRPVAVKVIRAEHADNADFRERFRHEVEAARRVSGVFTAAVVDADPDAPRPWMATAFVSGPSLATAVASRGPLSVRAVRILAAGLAQGLSEVHAAGLVHRDLKPSNVLLASDGPRIIDFGISRPPESADPIRTGGVIGSPGFMSPEQATGDPIGPASDIFCLGSVLAYAATGQPPFGAGSPSALLYRVVYGEASTVNIPPQLRPFIANCLIRDPAARPSTEELLAELRDAPPSAGWLEWQDPGGAAAGRWLRVVPSEASPGAAREASESDDGRHALRAGVAARAVPAGVRVLHLVADLPADSALAGLAAHLELADLPTDPVLAGLPADPVLADVPAAAGAAGVPAGAGLAGAAVAAADAVRADQAVAGAAGHRGEPIRRAARRPAAARPRHRRPERRGKQAALAAACALAVVIAGTLALSLVSRLEPGRAAAGQAATEGSGALGQHAGRQHPFALGHSQAPQATGAVPSQPPATGAAAPPSAGGSPQASAGQVQPTTVVLDFFAAIDQGNWSAAWSLGGYNLYPNRAAMASGYANVTGQNTSVVSANGDYVVARFQTANSWGSPEMQMQQFVVQHSVIVASGPVGFRWGSANSPAPSGQPNRGP